MKCFGMSVCALTCFAALSLPCVAQANPWDGSWKIDPGTIKYEGPTFSITTDATGYTMTRGGKAEPKTVCNGQPKAEKDGTMTTCRKAGSGYDLEQTRNGKQTAKVAVSVAGNTLTRKIEVFPPNESPFTITNVSKRVSGGPGFAGTWKSVSFNESQDKGILSIHVNGDTVAFKETDSDTPMMCKLDGTPTKFGDRTMAVKLDGPRTLKVTYRGSDGKVQRENTFVLSPNGKTVRETDVTPAPSASTESMVFHKM